MRIKSVHLMVMFATVLAAGASAAAVEVRLQVAETEQMARRPAVVTTGVPFARGAVKDVGRLGASRAGKPVPAQFIRTAPWDDGSVRWALMDVQVDVPAGGQTELIVSDAGGNPLPPQPVTVQDAPDTVTVSTGPLRFVISRKKSNLFESLTVDGRELVTSTGRGAGARRTRRDPIEESSRTGGGGAGTSMPTPARGLVFYTDTGEEVIADPPDEITIEQAGPMRAIVCARGRFPGVHNGLLRYTVRVSAFAGRKFVKVHVWLENHGASGHYRQSQARSPGDREPDADPPLEWLTFKGLSVDLGLALGDRLTAACEGVTAAAHLKVFQTCLHSRTKKMGTSAGPFYTWDDFEYVITDADTELKRGERTDGVVTVTGDAGALTAAIRGFWQNYEKAVELDGGALRLWLWPIGGEYPRPYYWLSSRYGIEPRVAQATKAGMYLLQSVHKGHEFILDFSGRDPKETAAELSAPLVALASAEYYAATEAAPGLFAPPEVRTGLRDADAKLAAWRRMAQSTTDPDSETGIARARRTSSYTGGIPTSSYWFGWMDFGDFSVDNFGPVHLHYDWVWITLLEALRAGDARAVHLATEMARHTIDIDQFWSDRDLPEMRGLQRSGGGYGSYHITPLRSIPDVRGNWLAGMVLYYMLTGEPKALECCRRNAEGLKAAWDWVAKARPYAGPQGDMAANAWSINSYGAMYRLTGDRTWLDEALGLFTRHVVPKWQELGPFLHDPIRQIRSQDYIQEDMKYCYAIASFCELHHLTGDETVFKLLEAGCGQEFPESFFEAPLFLSDLYAYVGWRTGNAALVRKAADLFAQSFPESRNPPVFLPGSTTWSRTAAMTLRTGHILQYANWKRTSAPTQ